MIRSLTAVVVVFLLLGCAGTRRDIDTAPAANPPEGGNVLATVRILQSWPEHPKLKFDMQQTAAGICAPPPPAEPRPPVEERQMSPEEFATFMAELEKLPADAVIAAPRVLVESGQQARVESAPGEADADGPSYEVVLTPTLTKDGSVRVELRYVARGFQTNEPASRFEDGDRTGADASFHIQPGKTQFLLAHGLIGAPMHLLAVTIERSASP
jgi:type IV secretory pathway VirB10-like protein